MASTDSEMGVVRLDVEPPDSVLTPQTQESNINGSLLPPQDVTRRAVGSKESSSPAIQTTPVPKPQDKTQPSLSLQQAARDNSKGIIDEWIEYLSTLENGEKKKKLDQRDEHGLAAIHYAAKFNRFDILVKLCENDADATLATAEELYTPLHYAAYYMPRYQVEGEEQSDDHSTQQKSYLCDSGMTVMYLVETEKVKLNAVNKSSESPLHLACRRGNVKAACFLLSQPDINPLKKDEHGDTPLHDACRHGWEDIVEELLKNRLVSPSFSKVCNNENQTPLHLACQEGHTEIVKKLLENCPNEFKERLLNAHDIEGNVALHLAIRSLNVANRKNDTEIVEILLEKGADPCIEKVTKHKSDQEDTEFGERITPLHVAARYGLVSVIERLLECPGVHPNVCDVNYRTPLHVAAMYNRPKAVTALIDGGADTEVTDISSCTPFLLAAANGHFKVVAKLEKRTQIDKLDENRRSAVFLAAEGAHIPLLRHLLGIHSRVFCLTGTLNVEASLSELKRTCRKLCSTPDLKLNTPLHIAAKLGHRDVVDLLLKDELVEFGHVTLDAKNESSKTPAHLAAESGNISVLKRLIETSGALVLDRDEHGDTPLHLAAAKGWKHTAKLLIERGAHVDARNTRLASPLSLAAASGYVQVVKLLLYFKAEVDVRDRSQATPLHHAVSNGRIDVVKVLIDSGAKCCVKNKDGYNALDLAIECGHEDVAKAIVQSGQWESALQNTTSQLWFKGTNLNVQYSTPFRKLIIRMPDVARDVLNRCTVYNEGNDGERETTYNYRYIEDVRTPSMTSSNFTDRIPFKWFKSILFRWIRQHFYTQSEEKYTNTWGPEKFEKATHPLAIMANSGDHRLISHPLVISLIVFKLRKYATTFFLIQLVFHIVLLVFLTLFALIAFNPNSEVCQSVFNGMPINNGTVNNLSEICDGGPSNSTAQDLVLCCYYGSGIHRANAIIVSGAIVLFTSIIRLMILLGSLIRYPIKFVKSLRRYIEVPMCLFSIAFVLVFWTECFCPTSWQWQLGTAAVLLVWVDFILVIRRVQVFDIGIYLLMFENIFWTFLRTTVLFILLWIAFAIAFYMAFFYPGLPFAPLATPELSVLTSLAYITGAADFNGVFALPDERSSEKRVQIPFAPISVILWITFVIVMVVLLINMLIGLAVDDIQGIKKAAEVQRLKLLVDWTLTVDASLFYRHLFTVPERTIKAGRKFSLWRTCNALLWKGKIVQDTPDEIAKALTNQSEPSIEQVHVYTQSLVKEMASMKETIKLLNDRNRRMEDALGYITTTLKSHFASSPNPDLEMRALSRIKAGQSESQLDYD